jgi:hypothetical protein
MSADFSVWAFTASDAAVTTWLSIVGQLPSVLNVQRRQTSNGNEAVLLTLRGGVEHLALVNVHRPSQFWVLETSSAFAPVFHWLLRYSEAQCIPNPKHHYSCSTPVLATEVTTPQWQLHGPSMVQNVALISPNSDLAITTYEVHDRYEGSTMASEYWAKCGPDLYLVFTEERLLAKWADADSPLTIRRPVRSFPPCDQIAGDLKFEDIWKYR